MKKILVANRGEIALRIMRSVKEMGIKAVAVYSEADRNAPFVKFSDEAYLLGPAPSKQSYLNGDKIIEICKLSGADGVHPGYGFLSENAVFADKVIKAGITFIGPSSNSMKIMGDKLAAKEAVKKYNIPLVPGLDKAIVDLEDAVKHAEVIGFPILLKASAGGGGKGMRVVRKKEDFVSEFQLAKREAESAFGDGSIFLEKFVEEPKHIEIQVIADEFGNVCHLFERECSIQRRHQKVIEEAPSAVLTSVVREKMGACAVDVAKSCDYKGVGTVEFLYEKSGAFYFLEMNTRLQVEHPVTELITGVDLVKEQIKIARGEKLSFKQEDLKINGHALEIRVYAEDPNNNFLPDTGKLIHYKIPQGPGVRVDDGFEEGMEIPIYYDPMISKLIVHGKDRAEALEKMKRAIDEYTIVGIETTLGFCKYVIEHKAFIDGSFDTNFVNRFFSVDGLKNESEEEMDIAALVAYHIIKENNNFKSDNEVNSSEKKSLWKYNRT